MINALRRLFGRRLVAACNTYDAAIQTHEDTITRIAEAELASRHLLVKQGSAANGVAVCGASDTPLGPVDNIITAADVTAAVQVSVALLGKGPTKKMLASGAINAGALVYAAASGKVASSGTVIVGIALTATTGDAQVLEVLDFTPPATPGIAASLYDAHTILYATTDNTPAALTVAEARLVGRITGGNIAALTAAQVRDNFVLPTTSGTTSAGDSLEIPVTHRYVAKTTGADAEALTLANGVSGQRITISLVVDGGGDGTLTPATCSGFTNIVLADAGDTVTLEYIDDTKGWVILGTAGVSAPPVIAIT